MSTAVAEALAVVVTGAVHIVFEGVLEQKLIFIVAASIGWITYLVWRVRRDPSALARWASAATTSARRGATRRCSPPWQCRPCSRSPPCRER